MKERYTIDAGDHRPIRQPLRRHPIAYLDEIDRQVDEMARHGLVEPASSPWSSNIVMVKREDGALRLRVDYRMLNSVTYQDTYQLPHIDMRLDALQRSS